jgi:hypothetical protein
MRLSRDGQPVRVLSPAAAKGDAAKGGAAPARDAAGKS